MEGRTVRLDRLDAARDIGPLFEATHGEDADPGQWTYMAYGPFESADAMRAVMARLVDGSQDPQWWLVREVASDAPVGMAAFMNMVPAHRRLELGHIWYVPAAQRTAVNTETIYLMLRESFDRLGYRRVEWKCDALNARSRQAALRLGFRFEGIFRQHCIVKGRNRDTAWFAMLDTDWPRIRENSRLGDKTQCIRGFLDSWNGRLPQLLPTGNDERRRATESPAHPVRHLPAR